MPVKLYKVLGDEPFFGYAQGQEFLANLKAEGEARALARGAIEIVDGDPPFTVPKQVTAGKLLGYSEMISNATSSAASPGDDVLELQTIADIADKPILVTMRVGFAFNTGSGGVSLLLYEDTTRLDLDSWTGGANVGKGMLIQAVRAPAAGLHTYKTKLYRNTANGVATLSGRDDSLRSKPFIMVQEMAA